MLLPFRFEDSHACTSQNQQFQFASRNGSDQPGHTQSLIRAVLSEPLLCDRYGANGTCIRFLYVSWTDVQSYWLESSLGVACFVTNRLKYEMSLINMMSLAYSVKCEIRTYCRLQQTRCALISPHKSTLFEMLKK